MKVIVCTTLYRATILYATPEARLAYRKVVAGAQLLVIEDDEEKKQINDKVGGSEKS